ncbi:MAG: hypothetical protein DRQ62_06180 [Gammaproteobacteria bacterium]|nr:MAG: hypothetical protein DRQ62_06180 [Gammaproteobacteria bacterium]
MIYGETLAKTIAKQNAADLWHKIDKVINVDVTTCRLKRAAQFRHKIRKIENIAKFGPIYSMMEGNPNGKDKSAKHTAIFYIAAGEEYEILLSSISAKLPKVKIMALAYVTNHAAGRLIQTFNITIPEVMLMMSPGLQALVANYHDVDSGTYAMLFDVGIILISYDKELDMYKIATAIAIEAMNTPQREYVNRMKKDNIIIKWK